MPVNQLLLRVGRWLGLELVIHDEVTVADLHSRPDIAVDSASGRIGFIELKASGKGTPETWRPGKHDREQWNKLKLLPNLIYTDGAHWALYRKGQLIGRTGELIGDLSRAGDRLRCADNAMELLLREFLLWRPPRPTSLRGIVAEVAPLCRLLREQVSETLAKESMHGGRTPFTKLAQEWRNILFPVTGSREPHSDFADSYAQAVTFALLLARVDGVSFEGRSPSGIAEQLSKQHSPLGEALAILANPKWVGHLNVVDTLIRIIGNIDWAEVQTGDSDAYAQLYETFLTDYDPALRRRSGTYYTPAPVARSMVRFVDEVLRTRLGKRRGFAADDVIVVDPAMGAGTFLAEILDRAAIILMEERQSDTTPTAHLRELFGQRLIGFEIQAAPYAVAELRLHTALKNRYMAEIPMDEPRFLTDALDNPDDIPLDFGQLYDVLKESREKANRVKRDVPVTVVIGNPPWRENARGAAPWLEAKRDRSKPLDTSRRPSMDEFRPSADGRRSFNLSNMWTFFWRWATWKAFEANEPAGIVALITPSAYLTSASYSGMREYLRRIADEGWIIDLSPELHRPDVRTRIFPGTQHPICIGVFSRSGTPRFNQPAQLHYMAIEGSQQEKFAKLAGASPSSSEWATCVEDWSGAFRPTDCNWTMLPALGDLMPWQQPGVCSNRNWVWAPDRATLERRWRALIEARRDRRAALFKETQDRKVSGLYPSRPGIPSRQTRLVDETCLQPNLVQVGYRSFDRQYLVLDRRVLDRPRPELWQSFSGEQLYICEQHTHPINDGPGLVFSALVPNVDFFRGHHGGRVLPLYRAADSSLGTNFAPKLLSTLSATLGLNVTAEDMVAYIAAITSHGGYTQRYREQLKQPGIRLPITTVEDVWREAVEIGREIIWLHTFGQRFSDEQAGRPQTSPRLPASERPRYIRPVPVMDNKLPAQVSHEPDTETLVLEFEGSLTEDARIGPVSAEVWQYRVGGTHVVKKWLSYRQSEPIHKRYTSELDLINPARWTAQFDDELLELLNVLGRCVALEPVQAELLERVSAGPVVTTTYLEHAGVLPVPAAARRPHRSSAGLFDDS